MRLLIGITVLLLSSPSWAMQIVTGSYTGNATDNTDIVISPACQPVAVFIKRDTAAVELFAKFNSMSGDISKAVSGTALESTTNIKSFNANGFRLGTGSSTNGNGSTHYYVAICDNGAGDLSFNSWSGNDADNRTIAISPSFVPELVLVLQSGSGKNSWRGATSHSGDSSSRLNALFGSEADAIQSFAAGSFQVGTSLNVSGTTYYSMAIQASVGAASGSYTGNAGDNRDIAAIANPVFVGIKGDSSTAGLSYRFTLSGDLAWNKSDAAAANIIQSLSSTGFQVGTSSAANESTVTMHWFALGEFWGRRAVSPIMYP